MDSQEYEEGFGRLDVRNNLENDLEKGQNYAK